MTRKQRVVVGLSGGVDSSVAAGLLQAQGFEVIGAMMKIWDGRPLPAEKSGHSCYGPGETEDIKDAQKVADALGIPLQVVDLSADYNAEVLEPFCKQYLCGRTPNPCVICNHKMKFGRLVSKIRASGIEFDYFATGHYARGGHDETSKRFLLRKAADEKKDQSYFLYHLSQDQLKMTLFPLGDMTKEEVRKLAREYRLEVALKKESQDFIAGNDYSVLFKEGREPGPILDEAGRELGRHQGIIFYTIGQRKGLRVSSSDPLYVLAIEPEKNAVIVGPEERLYADELIVCDLNWVSIGEPSAPLQVQARIRQKHKEAPATLVPLGKEALVNFAQAQMSITPGQAIVFYDRELVLGGGTIKEVAKKQGVVKL